MLWELAYSRESSITKERDVWNISNFRDFSYKKDEEFEKWIDFSIDPHAVSGAWFYVASLKNFGPLAPMFAHTAIVFDMENSDSVVCSIEAKRRKGEEYDPFFKGLTGRYPISYVWSTKKDFEDRRTIFQDSELMRYPLTVEKATLSQMITNLIEKTQLNLSKVETYNSITNQCTNILLKAMRDSGIHMSWHPYWNITGLSPRYLAKNGVVDLSKREEI